MANALRRNGNSVIRAIMRGSVMLVATLMLFAIYLGGRAMLFPSKRLRLRFRNFMVRRWAATLSRFFGMHAVVDGPRPTGAFLLVTNHVSYLDILLLSSVVDVAFIAKSEVRRWPLLGTLAASVGTIFIERDRPRDSLRVTTVMEKALAAGHGVALFPEGTSSDGKSVLPFKPSLLELAARNSLPVHHAAIRYSNDEAAWYGDTEFGSHLWQFRQIRSTVARLRFGHAIQSNDRKELAVSLHRAVREKLDAEQ
jgi:1-acyl-sn-glycerol-3-phosphate acyltransferase